MCVYKITESTVLFAECAANVSGINQTAEFLHELKKNNKVSGIISSLPTSITNSAEIGFNNSKE